MTNDGAPEPDPDPGHLETGGVTEPITLTDPDGSVTRVAPWSSWTREQVRAPGGEPALVTRLEAGQLWFAAGRRQSPWRHEIIAGPATVTTPRGRFHVVAEEDGGATVACLAGRTRVASRLREPVVLSPNQTAAVSSDGATLVVMDAAPVAGSDARNEDAREDPAVEEEPMNEADSSHVSEDPEDPAIALPAVLSTAIDGPIEVPLDDDEDPAERRAWSWLPEIVAVAAILGVLVAAAIVFVHGAEDTEDLATVAPTTSVAPTSTEAPSTSAPPSTSAAPSTTTAPTTTVAPSTTVATTTTPPSLAAPATATGALSGCRRADGGVEATVTLTHRSGGASQFAVEVGLAGADGQFFARASGQSGALDPGATAPVDVVIPVDGRAQGACELIGVAPA